MMSKCLSAITLLAVPFLCGAGSPKAVAASSSPSVVVAPISDQDVSATFRNVGHVTAIQSVELVPRVTAYIDQVTVQQGSDVKAGEILFRLQSAQYEAALQTAEASLASAQAAVSNANIAYDRAAHLNNSGFSPTSTLDQDLATRNEDQANVLAATAAISMAQLDLSYCTIVAPIDGRIGAVSLTKGNLVTSSTGSLATINQLDPIRVVFSVSTDSPLLYATHYAAGRQSAVGASAYKVSVDLPNGERYPYTGNIAFYDNAVDTQTGTVNIYADFANPESVLLPGAYVSVVTQPATPKEEMVVPIAAVQTDRSSSFVLVVGPDKKVTQQTVILGEQFAQNYVVKTGLTLGQEVIVDGIQKVEVGSVVSVTFAPGQPTSGDSSKTAGSQ